MAEATSMGESAQPSTSKITFDEDLAHDLRCKIAVIQAAASNDEFCTDKHLRSGIIGACYDVRDKLDAAIIAERQAQGGVK